MPRRAILRELIFRWFYGRPIFLKPFLVSRYQGSHLELPVKKSKVTESDYDAVINILRDPVTAPTVVPLNTDNADASKLIARADVPDLPDRIIAATARHSGLPFVTRNSKIQASGIPTIWQGFLYFLP